jgi:hypothetical protein
VDNGGERSSRTIEEPPWRTPVGTIVKNLVENLREEPPVEDVAALR